MKWRFDDYKHKHGDIENTTQFLLVPRKCKDGWWRWMERVNVKKEYYSEYVGYIFTDYRILCKYEYTELSPQQKFDTKFKDFLK